MAPPPARRLAALIRRIRRWPPPIRHGAPSRPDHTPPPFEPPYALGPDGWRLWDYDA